MAAKVRTTTRPFPAIYFEIVGPDAFDEQTQKFYDDRTKTKSLRRKQIGKYSILTNEKWMHFMETV